MHISTKLSTFTRIVNYSMVGMLWEKIENILDEKFFVTYEKSFEN